MIATTPAPTGLLLVTISCPPAHADALAQALVEARVAACVQALPGVRSTYRWQGAVQRDDETLLVAKTTAARFEALRETVLRHHSYELPEIVAVNVAHGHTPYLQWIEQCCT